MSEKKMYASDGMLQNILDEAYLRRLLVSTESCFLTHNFFTFIFFTKTLNYSLPYTVNRYNFNLKPQKHQSSNILFGMLQEHFKQEKEQLFGITFLPCSILC
jgi:hypothetical protein